ncbi:MAG: hypothetical protein WDN25_29425 [Acetobacteraceae bacterium]
MQPADVSALVTAVGFTSQLYVKDHPDLERIRESPSAILHFLLYGVLEGRRFRAKIDMAALRRLADLPFENKLYRTALVAALGYAGIHTAKAELDTELTDLWPTLLELCAMGAKPVLIIGDSHSNLYHRRAVRGSNWILPLHLLCSAGSAMGLGNPNSRSRYGLRIERLLEMALTLGWRQQWPILFKFGQVDTEFVHTFQRIAKGITSYSRDEFADFSARSIEGYRRFLDRGVPAALRPASTIVSVFPPSLSDQQWAEGYANGHIVSLNADMERDAIIGAIRQMTIPDIFERTRMHREYNERLSELAGQTGLAFIDDCDELLSAFGIANRRFVGAAAGRDHHLDYVATAPAITAALWRAIDRLNPPIAAAPG